MIYWTSDTHFLHANIIKYCARPFTDKLEMTEALITNWNETVDPSDTVYHLGDVAFCPDDPLTQILNRLNGKIVLVMGNHDRNLYRHIKTCFNGRFESMHTHTLSITLESGQSVLMSHRPIYDTNFTKRAKGWMLHGHAHGTEPLSYNMLDVGVDCHNYRPIPIEQVANLMKERDGLVGKQKD